LRTREREAIRFKKETGSGRVVMAAKTLKE